jgi:hypothetical protein
MVSKSIHNNQVDACKTHRSSFRKPTNIKQQWFEKYERRVNAKSLSAFFPWHVNTKIHIIADGGRRGGSQTTLTALIYSDFPSKGLQKEMGVLKHAPMYIARYMLEIFHGPESKRPRDAQMLLARP